MPISATDTPSPDQGTDRPSSRRIKGHWTKGKPRNAWEHDDWPTIRERTRNLIQTHRRFGERSGNALAKILGVAGSTCNEWLRGAIHPPESIREPLLAWIKLQAKLVRREAR